MRFFDGLSLEETGVVLGSSLDDDARLAGGAGLALQAPDARPGRAQQRDL